MDPLKRLLLWAILSFGIISLSQAQTRDLEYFLKNAVTNSPLLKDYQNQLKSGALDSQMIRATQQPQVTANGQIMFAPTYHGYGYDKAITNGGDYTAILALNQPLFNKHILAPQYRGIELQNQTLGNTARISQLELRKNITSQYIVAYADWQQYQSNQEVYTLLAQQQDILKKLVQSGLYKQSDYLNFQVALQTQEITLTQLDIQYRNDLSMLNYLCGIHDTSATRLVNPDISYQRTSGKTASLFYRQFTLDSLKIINNKEAIDAKYHPAISWFADAGLQSSDPATLDKNFGASFGLNLSIPVYDGKQRKLEYQRLKIAEETRTDYASFFENQYHQQRDMLEQQLLASENLVAEINGKLKSAQALIDVDKKQLNAGNLPITDYVLAINSYLNIRGSLNGAQVNLLEIINQLNYWNH